MEDKKITDIIPERKIESPFSDLKEKFKENNTVQESIQKLESLDIKKELENSYTNSRKIEILILGEYMGVFGREIISSTVSDIFKEELKSAQKNFASEVESYKGFLDKPNIQSMLRDKELRIKTLENEVDKCEKDEDYPYKWFLETKKSYAEAKRNVHKDAFNISKTFAEFFGEGVTEEEKERILSLHESVVATSKFEFKYFVNTQRPFLENTNVGAFNTTIEPEGNRAVIIPMRSSIELQDKENPEKGTKVVFFPYALRHELLHKVCDTTAKPKYDSENSVIRSNRGFKVHKFDPKTKEIVLNNEIEEQSWLTNMDEGAVTLLDRLTRGLTLEQSENDLSQAWGEEGSDYKRYALALSKAVRKVGIENFKKHYINNNPMDFLKHVERSMSREDIGKLREELNK